MKISVIIPVFNAEKYLAVCLESILIQTLQDYEVILVDDCSTDNSVAIAESYLEKFGGRLKIISLEENTGSGAVPRNVGLDFACGDYVYFMDNDDLLLDIALETLFNFAEEYQTDFVYMEKGFQCNGGLSPENLTEVLWNPPKFSTEEPLLEPENLAERVEKFLKLAIGMPPWGKFFRRDFLIDNGIKFPAVKISDDIIWTFELICLAKKILRIPMPLYIYRTNNQSVLNKKRSPAQTIQHWINPFLTGLERLNNFMNKFELFNQKKDLRLRVLHFFAKIQFEFMAETFKTLEPHEAYEIILREFLKAGSSQPALIAYLLVMANLYRNELAK